MENILMNGYGSYNIRVNKETMGGVNMSKKIVALVGSLDTKSTEYLYLKEQIQANGADAILIDVGVFGPGDGCNPEISAETVAKAGGGSLQELAAKNNRGLAMEVMSKGIAVVAKELYENGKFDGIIAMGGGGGTTVGTSAMRALPVGVPKLMVSTIASGDTHNYVGESDILMMPSIVDIAGINRFSAMILSNAAGAIVGMVNSVKQEIKAEKPLLAATMFGVTTPCVTRAKEYLEEKGYEVLVFHAVGSGGKTMEHLIRSGYIKGVLDMTTTELADELVGGILSAGPHRLEAAGEMGIPQVVSAGALDMVNFGPMDSVPRKFSDRLLVPHNPMNTLMRTTPEENQELAKIIAAKLNKAKGKTIFIIPQKGFSMMDAAGQVFDNPEADRLFSDTLKANLHSNIRLIEADDHINDIQFSQKAANLLIESLE
jgi:uncharacterized protein (UPF0261 family)